MAKRGMIEMMETFVVLFVVFIIIGFGMFLFYKFSMQSSKQAAQEVCVMDATQMIQSVLTIPEIQCSISGSLENCVDVFKLMAFNGTAKASQLGKGGCPKKVVFKQIYPAPSPEKNATECKIGDMGSFPDSCGQWTVSAPNPSEIRNKASRQFAGPVSLYYPHLNQRGVGKLVITAYTS